MTSHYKFKPILRNSFFCLLGIVVSLKLSAQTDPTLKVQYLFDQVTSDKTGVTDNVTGQLATFKNGAGVSLMGGLNVLNLGNDNGHLDFGPAIGNVVATLDSFTISTCIYIESNTVISDNGNFIWTFANSNDVMANPNGQMFFAAKSTRYAISKTNWSGESALNYNVELPKGDWKHIAYTQSGSIGNIYLDGVLVKSGQVNIKPSDLGATAFNYIGRSPYASDVYLHNSMLFDFRIYNRALKAEELGSLVANLNGLNGALYELQLQAASQNLTIGNSDLITKDLTLETRASNNITISWLSSNPAVITNTGGVTRPALGADTAVVKLTATLSKSGKSISKDFTVKVIPYFDDKKSVQLDASSLVLTGNLNNLRSNIKLPVNGDEGSLITWESDNNDFLLKSGELVKLAPNGAGKQKVTLTATVKKGTESEQKEFIVFVAENEGFDSYLFVYFTGNHEDIYYALSNDGFVFKALNGNNPIMNSDTISSTGGLRDPHILRGENNDYYMVATDMNVNANGWNPNYALVLMKSTDLVHWSSSVINIPQTYPQFVSAINIWAPQTIYDKEKGKYLVYWAMKKNSSDIFRIYYAYVNAGFTAFEGEPQVLFSSPTNNSCIDSDIVFNDGNSTYNLFFKTEGGAAGIKRAVATSLTGQYVIYDKYIDRTSDAVEGSCTYRLINSDTYVLMYDLYSTGKYQMTTSTDMVHFYESNRMSMNFAPRHGTVMPITNEEARVLAKKWAKSTDLAVLSSNSKQVHTRNLVINENNKTIEVPVKNGTDLRSFNPELTSIPGAVFTPSEPQDFTNGAINYTVSIDGIGSRTYQVTAVIQHNPVLDGFYADPEVLYSNKNGKYYIYPTSDGFNGWSGTYFKTFSSANLTDWKDEGVILDLVDGVSWSDSYAWAPTIIEKKKDGNYKYYYYFCATQKIGVAVADDPAGPFIDSGTPLISATPAGVGGQQIDPDVFSDPASGKNFIFWGNGYMARAELNDNMVSVKPNTTAVITPDETFREGAEVFYRNGKYYFLWSQDDTGSENYRVRYATSTAPDGSLHIPDNNLVIAKNNSKGIYGTGHNCVINVPGTDKWYIIYHRFNRPNGINLVSEGAAGYFREVCIDELKFDSLGNIIQVIPTLDGINPITNTDGIITFPESGMSITVYPTIATSEIYVTINNGNRQKAKGYIYDSMGKLIRKIDIDSQTRIDVSNLNQGVYLLKCKIGNSQIRSTQFIVQ